MVRDAPDSAETACLLALCLGHCRLLGVEAPWSLSDKRTFRMIPAYLVLMDRLTSQVEDLGWFQDIWPERLFSWLSYILERRTDLHGVYELLIDVLAGVDEKYTRRVDGVILDIGDSAALLDLALEEVLPQLSPEVLAAVQQNVKQPLVAVTAEYWWLFGTQAPAESP